MSNQGYDIYIYIHTHTHVTATGHRRIIVQELLCGPEVGEGDWRVFEP